MILKHFNKNVSIDEVKNVIKQEKEGVSAYEIIRVAKKYNVIATGYKNCDIKTINNLPIIAHTINNNLQHFVVVLKLCKNNVLIADPAKGILEVTLEDFYKIYTGIIITFENPEVSIKDIFNNKKLLLLITLITILLALMNLLYSYILSFIIENTYMDSIMLVLVLFFMIGLSKELLSFIKEKVLLKFQLLTDKAITIPTLRKIIMLPHKFYQQMASGELISKINDLSYIKDMVFSVSQVLFVNVIIIIISLIFISVINYFLLFINFLILLIILFLNKRFYKKHIYKTYDLQVKNEALGGKISDVLGGIISVKNLSKERYFGKKIVNNYNEVISDYKKISILYQKHNFKFKLVYLLSILLVITLLVNGSTTLNVLFSLYIESLIFDSLESLCSLEPVYANFKSAYLRVKDIWNETEIKDSFNQLLINDVCIKNLNYKYNKNCIINNLNLKISKGDFAMVTGPTGCGKSTLFKLLTKQLKLGSGCLYINGDDINEIDEEVLRKSITYVDQKTRLFNDSIHENIYLGLEDELRPSLKKIIDEELNKNSIDYNYIIDNTNSNLSGGQIQLIVIAQTLVNGGNLIIFDETTSQLDENTERKVLKAIKKDYKEKTIILVSHRRTNQDLFNKVINFDADKNTFSKRRINEETKKRRIKRDKSRKLKRLGNSRDNSRDNVCCRNI